MLNSSNKRTFRVAALDIQKYINMSIPKSACVLLPNQEGLILAVSRKNDSTDFGLPGGKCEKNESFEECAIRETQEETGLIVKNLTPVFADIGRRYFCVTYYVESFDGFISSNEEGVVKWVPISEILIGTFATYNKKMLSSFYLQDKEFRLQERINQKNNS